jgi:hypothetical protein
MWPARVHGLRVAQGFLVSFILREAAAAQRVVATAETF